MSIYKYEAMDATGREHTGEIDADNQKSAMAKIRKQGLFVTKISKPGLSLDEFKRMYGGGGRRNNPVLRERTRTTPIVFPTGTGMVVLGFFSGLVMGIMIGLLF